jgi:choline dehydrogenase-like flavoprotein
VAEVIIIGAGAAGVAAALQCARRGFKPLILDVGLGPDESKRIDEDLYAHRRQHDTFNLQIGSRYQALGNLLGEVSVPVKLTSPNFEYVTRDAALLGPVDAQGFQPVQSFAAGGLANAWGAGLYRFTDDDLAGFPIKARDLDPYSDILTEEIGICGAPDDLTPFFGSPQGLLPPLRLSHNAASLYRRYERSREKLNPRGFYIGLPRTAVLSQPYDGRPAYDYCSLEFWQESPSLYTPRLTLEKLIQNGQVDYQKGRLVQAFHDTGAEVQVDCLRLPDRQPVRFTARAVLLAAGAINTARLALQSAADTRTVLPLLENPAVQIPFVLPASLGRPLEKDAFGLVQLNLIWKREGEVLQGSIMEITSPMRAEFFSSFPLAASANLALIRHLLPAMMVMQFYYPGRREHAASLSLRPDGCLDIQGGAPIDIKSALPPLLSVFRRLGAWTHPALIVGVPMGHAIHYAGTLPMSATPAAFTCDHNGKLFGEGRVYVVDSATFPRLTAKNMSFGMMANAMRIANHAVDELAAG